MLPFELRVLEAALRDVTSTCRSLSKDVEADANPALDALTRSVRPPWCWRARLCTCQASQGFFGTHMTLAHFLCEQWARLQLLPLGRPCLVTQSDPA